MDLNNEYLVMIICLTLTILIEVSLAFILGVRKKRDFLNIILVNIMTNPIVVTLPILLYILFNYSVYRYSIYILEVLAVILEGLVYLKILKYRKLNPFALSLILNAVSFGIGLIFNI